MGTWSAGESLIAVLRKDIQCPRFTPLYSEQAWKLEVSFFRVFLEHLPRHFCDAFHNERKLKQIYTTQGISMLRVIIWWKLSQRYSSDSHLSVTMKWCYFPMLRGQSGQDQFPSFQMYSSIKNLTQILLALYIWGKRNSEKIKRKSNTAGQRGAKKINPRGTKTVKKEIQLGNEIVLYTNYI